MPKFRKVGAVVTAEQFMCVDCIPDGMKVWPDETGFMPAYPNLSWGFCDTPDGRMDVHLGDWIVTTESGERSVCKPGFFGLLYEAVDES